MMIILPPLMPGMATDRLDQSAPLNRSFDDFQSVIDQPSIHQRLNAYKRQILSNTDYYLFLLQPVTLSDLNCKPNKMLTVEDQRIATLAAKTDLAWKTIEEGSDF